MTESTDGTTKEFKVNPEYVKWVIENSEAMVFDVFDCCTVVAMKSPDGFVYVESSACVNPENYDREVGQEQCIKRINDQVWKMCGYEAQSYYSWFMEPDRFEDGPELII